MSIFITLFIMYSMSWTELEKYHKRMKGQQNTNIHILVYILKITVGI